MLQTGKVTRHAYNVKTSYTHHERKLNIVTRLGTNTSYTLQDGKLRREAALLQGRVLTQAKYSNKTLGTKTSC